MERLRGRLHWSARMGYWLASQQGFERVRTGHSRSLVRFARLTQLVCIRLVLGQVRAARKARSGRISFGVFEAALRDLRSWCVSVWCWDKYELPEKREAAEYHLGYLRQRF